ncbi:MAG: DedA family protein [Bacteroidota bacterium]
MAELFADIFNWVAALPPVWAYVVIFVIAYGENVVPPIPGDMVVVFGGYLAGIGALNFFMVWSLSTLGGALGFMSMYALGHRMGNAVYDPNRFRWLPKKQLEKARVWVAKWGGWVIVANRFLSGARSVISLSVGMAKRNAAQTTLLSSISALVWTGLIIYGGYAVGENWQVVGEYIRVWGVFVLALMAVGALIWFGRKFWLKRKTASGNGSETGG